jgi:hypothetical protein
MTYLSSAYGQEVRPARLAVYLDLVESFPDGQYVMDAAKHIAATSEFFPSAALLVKTLTEFSKRAEASTPVAGRLEYLPPHDPELARRSMALIREVLGRCRVH